MFEYEPSANRWRKPMVAEARMVPCHTVSLNHRLTRVVAQGGDFDGAPEVFCLETNTTLPPT